jgi:long-chain fatty acid transport protein
MTRTRLVRLALGISALSGSMLVTNAARANGYLAARFGSDHGTPAMANGYAVYYNPAALGGTEKTTIVVDGTFVIRTAKYTRTADALSPTSDATKGDATYFRANTGTAKLTNFLALPYLGVSSDLGTKDFRVGYAFYVPYGGSAKWDKKDEWNGNATAPGAVDGPQRWANISGSIELIYNTFAVAYRIAPIRLTIGASLSIIYTSVRTVRARNANGSDDVAGSNGAIIEGRSLVDASGVNLGAAAGLYFEPLKDRSLRLGFSYTTQPGFGTQRLKGKLEQQFGTTAAVAPAQDVDFIQTFPDLFRLGAAWRASKSVELRLDGYYILWSRFKRQCIVMSGANCDVDDTGKDLTGGQVIGNIPRQWQNSFGVRAGAAYFLSDVVELFGSLATTSSPVTKETIDASTIDSQRVYFTLGGRFSVSEHVAFGTSANYIWFAPVDTAGANRLDQFVGASHTPSGDGKYRQAIFYLNANASYTF